MLLDYLLRVRIISLRGNWWGHAPYKHGRPCSACPPSFGGGCRENLCYKGMCCCVLVLSLVAILFNVCINYCFRKNRCVFNYSKNFQNSISNILKTPFRIFKNILHSNSLYTTMCLKENFIIPDNF